MIDALAMLAGAWASGIVLLLFWAHYAREKYRADEAEFWERYEQQRSRDD